MEKKRFLDEILVYNEKFVAEKKYEEYETTKFPNKRTVILTCMDTRLLELLPKAINIANGDAKFVKNAGALVSHPFGSIMRSILVAVYELQAEEVFVIGHYDCGMSGMKAGPVIEKMKLNGVTDETFETLAYAGLNVTEWFEGFTSVRDSVAHSVEIINKHPLMPKNVPVHGLVIDPKTGKLDLIVNGYNN
ncbi:beta-class carbonic anhydrase [Bacillus sp. CGMCC 1.16607]|uniref:beta-class carbonic anhydrase n=1 Tax=Bacillus sp. CGMCC 1.16607 TaxID=3351842 RepID=UPI003633C31E